MKTVIVNNGYTSCETESWRVTHERQSALGRGGCSKAVNKILVTAWLKIIGCNEIELKQMS